MKVYTRNRDFTREGIISYWGKNLRMFFVKILEALHLRMSVDVFLSILAAKVI